MLLQELGDRERARRLTCDAQVERLDALQDLPGIERGQRWAEIVHVLGLDERCEGLALSEPLPEHQVAEAAVRGGELRPAFGLCAEVERSLIDDDAAE